MRRRPLNSYTAYSIGCATVWAVILAATSVGTDRATRHTIMLVFGGWVIGWLSATIARRALKKAVLRLAARTGQGARCGVRAHAKADVGGKPCPGW